MQKAIVILLFIVAFTVSGCNTTALPTQPIVESQATAFPTLTPSPLPTATEPSATTTTLTPEPGLKTKDPYFAYFREVNGVSQFVMMDADGGGRKAISLPQGITDSLPDKNFGLDMKFISPDGKWLAFYTGSAGNFGFGSDMGNGPFDLTLNLLDLDTDGTQVIAPLLSNDYPNNFVEAAKKINSSNITSTDLQYAFLAGITRAISWSPTGRYLAFAGQMDGLSSDLYVYELETGEIQRLSSGDQELQWIEWSPDEKWILHGSVFEFGMGTLYDIYAASLDGTSVKYLAKASATGDWLNSHAFVVYDNQNVFGNFEFRLVDIEADSVRKIWDGPLMSYALNVKESKFAAVAHMFAQSPYLTTDPDPNFVSGLYLIDLKTFKVTNIKTSDGTDLFGYYTSSFGVGDNIFAFTGFGINQNPYLLSESSELSMLDVKRIEAIKSSPDASYWIAITDKTINIYSATSVQVNSIDLPFQGFKDVRNTTFIWQPDSSGLILIHETSIYFVNIATGETKLVENNLLDSFFSPNYMWIDNK